MEKNINLVILILILIYLLHLIAMSLKFSSICISIYSLIHLISFLKIFIKEKTILFTFIFNISEHLLMSNRLFATWMTKKFCLFYSHTNCISGIRRFKFQLVARNKTIFRFSLCIMRFFRIHHRFSDHEKFSMDAFFPDDLLSC